jgi:hypothetical protein
MVEHTEFWGAPVARPNERPRPLESARCSLCGIELPKGLMMPDGGRACADIRWYCKDAKSCTERWTARLSRDGRAERQDPDDPERPGAGERPAVGERARLELGGAPLAEAEESQRAGGV